jgi:cation-transporting ATPase 13A3/4/5
MILGMTLLLAILSLVSVRSNLKRVSKLSILDGAIKVLRDGGQIISVKTSDLVPGDLIIPEEGLSLPCDCLMLSGTVLVDESTLTGESNPVFKSALENLSDI